MGIGTNPFDEQMLQKDGDNNFVFNLKKKNNQQIIRSNMKNNGGVSDFGIANQRIQDNIDLDLEIKNSQSYLFNSKKFFKKNKDSTRINDSDIILKNEELKEEFLNENNLILDFKGNKYIQSKNSNYETSNSKIDYTLEMRRMIVEFIK